MKIGEDRKRSLRSLVIMIAIFFIALFIAYQKRDAVRADLDVLKLIPAPEHFTELYFNDILKLPQQTAAGGPIRFSFTIHDEEGAAMAYPYIVYFENRKGERTVFASGTVALADGASASVTVSQAFPAANDNGKVVVKLTSLKDQSIALLLPNPNL